MLVYVRVVRLSTTEDTACSHWVGGAGTGLSAITGGYSTLCPLGAIKPYAGRSQGVPVWGGATGGGIEM
jgi:hypothetical protein